MSGSQDGHPPENTSKNSHKVEFRERIAIQQKIPSKLILILDLFGVQDSA